VGCSREKLALQEMRKIKCMRNILRKQAYFAVISFIVLCVGLSITQFVFGFSISPAPQQSPVGAPSAIPPSASKTPFGFNIFLLIVALVMLVGGSYLSYFSWFRSDKARANLERIRELAQQGQIISLRHDYSQINTTAYVWFVRFLSPIMALFGLILFWGVVSSL
jgi:hypothetical protein